MVTAKPLAISIGDPLGIGPEVVAKVLGQGLWTKAPLTLLGDIENLTETAASLGVTLPSKLTAKVGAKSVHWPVRYVSSRPDKEFNPRPGIIAARAVDLAVQGIAKGDYTALVTGPINKARLHDDGIQYDGHTEMLQDLANLYWPQPADQTWQSDMLFVYQYFRLLLLTRHVPLSQVGATLNINTVARSLAELVLFLRQRAGVASPRIAVMGVNPHAGEVGGTEEAEILIPAIHQVNQLLDVGIQPPLAADGLFRGFNARKPAYDAYVAAYHDQGLIPFKLVAGLKAVNVTIGLPFIRTSVSHGTADDIVGQGEADPQSLVAALDCAYQLAMHRPRQHASVAAG
jgi:4-hydroxythreonine-4-phosphate dehydrogenase